jgi:hypothetical protein
MKIVITHGRDQAYQIPDTLERDWTDAVRFGLRRVGAPEADSVEVGFAFYGDLWRPDHPIRAHDPADDDEAVRGAAPVRAGAANRDREATASRDHEADDPLDAALREPPSQFTWDIAQELAFGEDEETTRFGARDVGGIVTWLDQRLGVGRVVLGWFLKDLDEYFRDDKIRSGVAEVVSKRIRAADDDVVLLGHSMGSIVAYDLLAGGVAEDLRVKGLVTFGSPLGMPTLRKRVAHLHPGTPFPPGLPRWINVYNPDDWATLERRLKPLYGPGSDLLDVGAVGHGPDGGLGSAHDPKVYLSSDALARPLAEILAST